MKTKCILNTDGQLTGLLFEEIQSIEDLMKAQQTINRLIFEIDIQVKYDI